MLHSNQRSPNERAGFTLLESMVALAIVALMTSIAVSGIRGPSPKLQLERAISAVKREASNARLRAVTEQIPVVIKLPGCEIEEVDLTYYPDGSATGPLICVATAGFTATIRVSPLTGKLDPENNL